MSQFFVKKKMVDLKHIVVNWTVTNLCLNQPANKQIFQELGKFSGITLNFLFLFFNSDFTNVYWSLDAHCLERAKSELTRAGPSTAWTKSRYISSAFV